MKIYTEQDIRRFYSYVQVGKEDECWEWLGFTAVGYGMFMFDGKPMKASRFIWWFTTGQHPEELYVCHHCDNKMCVNPKHLFLGTQKENMQDAVRKGRIVHGAKHYNARLTENDVREIRAKRTAGISCHQLTTEYGVSFTQIWNIVRRKQWVHI